MMVEGCSDSALAALVLPAAGWSAMGIAAWRYAAGGGGGSGAEMGTANMPTTIRELVGAAVHVMEDLELGVDDEPLVVSAIHLLSTLGNPVDQRQRTAQFPASLRTMLLLCRSTDGHSEEAGVALDALLKGAMETATVFEYERASCRRGEKKREHEAEQGESGGRTERVRDKSSSEHHPPEMDGPIAALAEAIAGAAEDRREAAPSGRPAHWIQYPDDEGRWHDPELRSQVKALRKNQPANAALFEVRGSGREMEFRCVVRWAKGPVAAMVHSRWDKDYLVAFEDACRQVRLAPDEPFTYWDRAVVDRMSAEGVVDKAHWPNVVKMENVVPVGIPRYRCTAYFGDGEVHLSSTLRETARRALEEVVQRCVERARSTEGGASRVLSPHVRLERAGIHDAKITVSQVAGGWEAAVRWLAPDGQALVVKQRSMEGKMDAEQRAVSDALQLDREKSVDWVTAARKHLPGAGKDLSCRMTRSELASVAQFQCVVSWGLAATYMVSSRMMDSRRSALGEACILAKQKMAELATLKTATTFGAHGEEARLRLVEQRLKEGRDRWERERAALLKNGGGVEDQVRMRDLSNLLSMCDPARRQSVDVRAGLELAERLIRGDPSLLSADGRRLLLEEQRAILSSLLVDRVPAAGGRLKVGAGFDEVCSKCGLDRDAALAALERRKLINRKDGDARMTLSRDGAALLVKYGVVLPARETGLGGKASVLSSMR